MTKLRILIFLSTLLIISIFGTFASYYARGYRFDFDELQFVPRGILVVNSDPNGAQIFVDGDLKSATNATISLAPGTYDLAVRKDGYHSWEKRIQIKREEVTQINASLFTTAPSLSAITFSGATNAVVSDDYSKIAYVVPPDGDNGEKVGLWVVESINLPIGFNKAPKLIAEGDFTEATIEWSPDAREILVTVGKSAYLFDASTLNPQTGWRNILAQVEDIKIEWQEKAGKRLEAELNKLPDELEKILSRNAVNIRFSPDGHKVLYTASGSAQIPDELIKQLPGASTQKEERGLKDGQSYVYDIKEDRNFLVATSAETVLYWFPSSNQLIEPKEGEVIIFDYDGTNRQSVYSGSYIAPHAYPYGSTTQMVILTNLGSIDNLPNLYTLNVK